MTQLSGKIAIITGAGTGIGKGIARAFAKAGATLVLSSRNRSNLEEMADEARSLGATVEVIPADVTVEEDVIALFAQTMEHFGRVDILVNNSGAFDGGPLEELSLETWRKVIDVNLTGPFLCAREAMKIMKAQGGGRIINIGSISAQMPRMDSAPYTSSKHGLVGLTKCIALEGRAYGISAGCLHPGNVLTERRSTSDKASDQEPMMSVDELASIALAMAALPGHVTVLESIVLPVEQLYVGRG
jgi:NAD(P)-dependent dehydrogenase (short-subunit alcohol dehydrogenase family)